MSNIVNIPVEDVCLEGSLNIPEQAHGIVIFSHGSGSSRHSPRNNYVARVLNEYGIATLLTDLLTANEDQDYNNRFDIGLLSKRLELITDWVIQNKETSKLKIGYFGASTGAASAIIAAVGMQDTINAVVSRGGRPDLAYTHLALLNTPTLFIVGGDDDVVIELNEKAFDSVTCKKELKIIPGATHLFEEPGTLEQAAQSALNWFKEYL